MVRRDEVTAMTRWLAMSLAVALSVGLGCAGGRERSEPEHASIDRCANAAGSGAITHDQARESHQTGGPPVGGYSAAGPGVRNDAGRPPEWWGRGDDRVEPCGQGDSSVELEGPLLLRRSGPRRDDAPSDEPPVDASGGDVAP